MGTPSIARILVERTKGLLLDYTIPQELLQKVGVGSRVEVPLGKGKASGMVLELLDAEQRAAEPFPLKPLLRLAGGIETPLLCPELLELGHWIASYYYAPLASVLKTMLPGTIRQEKNAAKKERFVELRQFPLPATLATLEKRAPKQAALLRELLTTSEQPFASLLAKSGASHASLQSLLQAGWIKLISREVARDPFARATLLPPKIPQLNHDQATILKEILCALHQEHFCSFLLHGVTGSGKTEIYLRAMEATLAAGKSALILVPEISLTPQTVERFRARFEKAGEKRRIAILHSHLSEGERRDEWLRIHSGEACIAIGARSAIFAPLKNLGLIIVDEEHEGSYKQEETPRYHARDVAVMRARLAKCSIILGSATPSLESYQNTKSGKYRLLELPHRADHQKMPLVRVVDMRLQGKQPGADHYLSLILRRAITERLERGEQTILFLNRRGFSTSLTCPQCGFTANCHDCSISLTFHRNAGKLICHLCGHTEKAPHRCPQCGSPEIRYSGIGTERVEAALHTLFPQARIARMDSDTMRGKGIYEKTLQQFRQQKIEILLGTQMIAKGLDFPNVTLVGIINADTSLHTPDFRAGERTFGLLTQVAGRAGRGDREGEVIIQTYTPENPALQFARHHDYLGFFAQEQECRQLLHYPPFTRMILFQLRGKEASEVACAAERLEAALRQALPEPTLLGKASPAPIEKAHGQYRYQISLRTPARHLIDQPLRNLLDRWHPPRGIILTLDVDPYSLL